MNILVTGATGKQGGATASALLARNHQVRAMTRKRESDAARRLERAGAEIVTGDFRNRESMAAAMEGVDAVFAVTEFLEAGIAAEVGHGRALIDTAWEAGVNHLVYSSVSAAARRTGVPHFDSKHEIEQYLASTNLPHTVIAPVAFMENALILPHVVDGLQRGIYREPLPADRKVQQVAVEDIGRFAAWVIEHRESMLGERISLASDELSGTEQARILSGVLGTTIRYEEAPLLEVRRQSEELAMMYEWFDRVGHQVDIAALRQQYPDIGWHGFTDWAAGQDWEALAR